jgi:hypothetical protein
MAEEATAVAAAPAAAAPAAPAPAAPSAPAVAATPAAPDASAPAAAVVTPPAAAPVVTEAAKPATPATAPEKYEFVAPKDQVLDPAVVTEFSGLAKELNLSQEAAQKVIDKMAPLLAKTDATQYASRITKAVETASAEWVTQSKADKEFGGDKFDANLALAKLTFDTYGTPELKALLQASGLDNHPEMIRWAYRTGKQLAPDGKVVTGNTNNAGNLTGSFEERASAKLYGG